MQKIDNRSGTLIPFTSEINDKPNKTERYHQQLDRLIWPLFTDAQLQHPSDSRNEVLDHLHGQGLKNIRDLFLLDMQLREVEPYNWVSIRGRIEEKTENLPWQLGEEPSISRTAELSRTLSDIPLQVAIGGLFGSERHRLVGDRRVTVADALSETSNFLALYNKGARAAVGDAALYFAKEFNEAKGNTFQVENPHIDGPPNTAIIPVPLPPGVVTEHMRKFGNS